VNREERLRLGLNHLVAVADRPELLEQIGSIDAGYQLVGLVIAASILQAWK
jgi:hypothetical protein